MEDIKGNLTQKVQLHFHIVLNKIHNVFDSLLCYTVAIIMRQLRLQLCSGIQSSLVQTKQHKEANNTHNIYDMKISLENNFF